MSKPLKETTEYSLDSSNTYEVKRGEDYQPLTNFQALPEENNNTNNNNTNNNNFDYSYPILTNNPQAYNLFVNNTNNSEISGDPNLQFFLTDMDRKKSSNSYFIDIPYSYLSVNIESANIRESQDYALTESISESNPKEKKEKEKMEDYFPDIQNSINVKPKQKHGDRNWTYEFRECMEMRDSQEKFIKLKNLGVDFLHCAETYGKIIIQERSLPNEKKTIPPAGLKGIAGGEKFIVRGILFKFATDQYSLYGSIENAMKAANHDLKGLTNFYSLQIPYLNFPLMTLLTFRGWRLICLSVLPIHKESIVYGSVDAGNSVFKKNEELNQKMKTAAELLNLKPHIVCENNPIEIETCCDLEGHLGSDGRFYLLDFARVAPPTPPTEKGSNLFNLFRLEFVKSYPKPLSSDAFSIMGKHNQKEHCQEIIEAFNYLKETTILNFTKKFQTVYQILTNSKTIIELWQEFILSLHTSGINLRYMGSVYQFCENHSHQSSLILYAFTRTAKSLLEELFRTIPSQEAGLFPRTIADFLNLIWIDQQNTNFYENVFIPRLLKKYPGFPTDLDKKKPFDYVSYPKFILLFGYFVGINWKHNNFDGQEPVYETDIEQIQTRVSHLNIMDRAYGVLMYFKSKEAHSPYYSKQKALQYLKSSIIGHPNFTVSLIIAKILRSEKGDMSEWIQPIIQSNHPLNKKALIMRYKSATPKEQEKILESPLFSELDKRYLTIIKAPNKHNPHDSIDIVKLIELFKECQNKKDVPNAQYIYSKCVFDLLCYYRSGISNLEAQILQDDETFSRYCELVKITSEINLDRFISQYDKFIPGNWIMPIELSIIPELENEDKVQRYLYNFRCKVGPATNEIFSNLILKRFGSKALIHFLRYLRPIDITIPALSSPQDYESIIPTVSQAIALRFEGKIKLAILEKMPLNKLVHLKADTSKEGIEWILNHSQYLNSLTLSSHDSFPIVKWSNLSHLTTLIVSKTEFDRLEVILDLPHLYGLDVSECKKLTIIPNLQSSNLRFLNITNTNITNLNEISKLVPNLTAYYYENIHYFPGVIVQGTQIYKDPFLSTFPPSNLNKTISFNSQKLGLTSCNSCSFNWEYTIPIFPPFKMTSELLSSGPLHRIKLNGNESTVTTTSLMVAFQIQGTQFIFTVYPSYIDFKKNQKSFLKYEKRLGKGVWTVVGSTLTVREILELMTFTLAWLDKNY